MNQLPRVRFAPSPTGPLHIGGVRTALFNYLFAKKYHGKFIVRIEDTDQERFVPDAERYLFETLQWLGIEADEDPIQGGPYSPYRQSERKHIYQQYALQLITENKAYYAFDTHESLDNMRKQLKKAAVKNPQYNAMSRSRMKNSLTLPQSEVTAMLRDKVPYVIRIKVPHQESVRFYDEIRGWIKVDTHSLDDKILMKSDGMPTYHLANVIDDYLMQITHVIRGEEWLPSTPVHMLLYQYFGWTEYIPKFVHLPLLLKPDGVGKLSKRDATQQGYPVLPLNWPLDSTQVMMHGFREAGYFPAALLNFLILLGWSPRKQKELMSKEEMINYFSLDRIGKAGAKFEIQKAQWFNQQYLRKEDDAILANYLVKQLKKKNIVCTQEKAQKIAQLLKERAVFLHDLVQQSRFFFETPKIYDKKVIQKKYTKVIESFIYQFFTDLVLLEAFTPENIRNILHKLLQIFNLKQGTIMPIVRIAITGMSTGPDLLAIMHILDKNEVVKRIKCFYAHYKDFVE